MAVMTLTSMNQTLKDMYPLAGTRLKQWVVDARREAAWERETCPMVDISEHVDNTDAECRNVGRTRWSFLDHDCCETCNVVKHAVETRPDIVAWIAEKAARPPVETDHEKLSDEIEPDRAFEPHPTLTRLR